jgi:hypothetical protein
MTALARDEQITAIAEAFAEIMRQWLTPAEFEEMRRRNVAYDDMICASHDFCDANMAMAAAMQGVLAREPDPGSGDDAALWNEAWTLAKRLYFTA